MKSPKLPDDLVQWVKTNFQETDRQQALFNLENAVIHTGEPAEARLLRCAAVGSHGDLRRLNLQIARLRVDWRDVIMAGEYGIVEGKLMRLRDLTKPLT